MANQLRFSGLVLKCKSDEFAVFDPPAGQNCSSWGLPFVNVAGGYIDNLMATAQCRYCQYAVGDQFFVPLNISFSHRWRDVFIIFAFFGEFLLPFETNGQSSHDTFSIQPYNHD